MKAFCLAFVYLVSIVPAGAGEMSSSSRGLRIGETETSRMYRAEWILAYSRSRSRPLPLSTNSSGSVRSLALYFDGADAANASFDAKVRAAVSFARKLARRAAARGSESVSTRVRVRCLTKYVVVKSKSRSASLPPSMWPAVASEPNVVRTAVEVCSIKLTQRQRLNNQASEMMPYTVSLPPLDEASP